MLLCESDIFVSKKAVPEVRNMKRVLTFSLIIICILFHGAAFAAEVSKDPLKQDIAKKAKEYKNDIDPVISELLKKGTDARILVKACIEMGYEACKVTTVALREKADRQMVIFGALDGGATNEQLSLCEGLGYAYDPPASIEGLNPNPPRKPVSNSTPAAR
jgi:hypothetical protein